MKLGGQVAIVTGAGRGIGHAIAEGLAREGAAVVLNYPDSSASAEDAARAICSSEGKAIAVQADVQRLEQHARLISAAVDHFGRLDILVNNAGVQVPEPFLKARPESWDLTLGVNLKASYFLSQKAARVMMAAGHGKILNISSIHDTVPLRDRSIYSISKAGVSMLTKALAMELAEHRINVNAIAPGAILTDMNRDALSLPAYRENLLGRIPVKRIGSVEDVVGAAVFLCSPESDYVTGETIYVDGGIRWH